MKTVFDTIPADVLTLDDYQRLAEQHIPADRLAYIQGGAGSEATLDKNTKAFEAIELYSRILSSVGKGSTALKLLDDEYMHPLFLAPVAHQSLVLDKGELSTLAGAEAVDATMITSTLSSVSLEELSAKAKSSHWFQLYFQANSDATYSLVNRAQEAGYRAIVVTLDVPITALRHRAQRAGFTLPQTMKEANLEGLPQSTLPPLNQGESRIFQGAMRQAPTWDDLEKLIHYASVPIWVKGIIHPDDAKRVMALGAAGIIVSNHGGRSLDSVPATINALPIVRKALGDNAAILVDGGIRTGGDVFKALALGANAVLIGRPQVYALAVAGALGVAHMLRTLREELEVTMALAGCSNLSEIGPHCIVKVD